MTSSEVLLDTIQDDVVISESYNAIITGERLDSWPTELQRCVQRLLKLWSHKWGCSTDEVLERLKPEQLEVIRRLLALEDIILIAKTGFGKSLIFQSIPLLRDNKTAIIVYPLIALEEDQHRDIQSLPGGRALILNSKTQTDENFKDIVNGVYTHVLTSPEILLGKRFHDHVWLKDVFRREHLVLIAIDEMHVVEQWGSGFRPEYSRLHELRVHTINDRIPWFGTTATLEVNAIEACRKGAGFQTEGVIRTPIDRPEISLCFKPLSGKRNYEDLAFLAPPPTSGLIQKTVIYCDVITEGTKIVNSLRDRLIKAGHHPTAAKRIVRIYNSKVDDEEKKMLNAEFRKADSKYRIFVATDALGMGVNNPDICLVIQYGVPKGTTPIAMLIQRAGRAARSRGMKGEFIFFIDKVYDGKLPEDLGPKPTAEALKNANKRLALDKDIYRLFNSEVCRREICLSRFGAKKQGNYRRGCCNFCDPDGVQPPPILVAGCPVAPEPAAPKHIQNAIINALKSWRVPVFEERFKDSLIMRSQNIQMLNEKGGLVYDQSEAFLSDDLIKEWAKSGAKLQGSEGQKCLTGWSSRWTEQYQQSILDAVRALDFEDIQARSGRMAQLSQKASQNKGRRKEKKQPNQHTVVPVADTHQQEDVAVPAQSVDSVDTELEPAPTLQQPLAEIAQNSATGRATRRRKTAEERNNYIGGRHGPGNFDIT